MFLGNDLSYYLLANSCVSLSLQSLSVLYHLFISDTSDVYFLIYTLVYYIYKCSDLFSENNEIMTNDS